MAGAVKKAHPYIEATPKKFGAGNSLAHKKDMAAIVRWPKCVQLQRKRAVLLRKLKMPPALYQFHTTLNKNQASTLFKFLQAYRPETVEEKKARLVGEAEKRAAGAAPTAGKPYCIKFGLDQVTKLVEHKKAALVIIAHDVMPVELVAWLPTLCRKMQVPYVIVKGKARLGAFVHQKNAAVLALDTVKSSDRAALEQLTTEFAPMFIDNADARRRWGN